MDDITELDGEKNTPTVSGTMKKIVIE